jgi:type IV pilus biogenesis protein CpaD/CtpE
MRLAAVLFAVLALTLAACAEDDEREAGAPADATRLQVEITEAGPKPIQMQLVCSGRCDIEQLRSAIAGAQDEQRACTLQYGGPEKAHATGTVDGEPIDVTIDRADGCGIHDYDALFAAFGREPPLAR